ncbi:MAG: hypothetical protein ACR2H4_15035 [Pyrinomonadaceae bacterium]|jgi:hypothetical protein
MNQAARKAHQLSIVRPVSQAASTVPDSTASLNDLFGGWLESVAPRLSQQQPSRASTFPYQQLPISTTDIVRVNRATVRESTAHRHWPPDVVAQFLTAEVITRRNKRT